MIKKASKKPATQKAKNPNRKAARKAAGSKPHAEKSLSAIDAAAKVLGEAKQPMNAKQMIEAMQAKGYWASPKGKTPHATLYTAVTMLPKAC